MQNAPTVISLEDLGTLRAHGPDAIQFLQGQLSNDLAKLSPERSLLAGYHNPQGRTIALLRLLWLGANDVLAVLPRELVPTVAARLSKFVLRAKVKVQDVSTQWRVYGHIGAEPSAGSDRLITRVSEQRWVAVCRETSGEAVDRASAALDATSRAQHDREAWRRLDIAAGLPQVVAATSEEFVAQMLNLDALDAIAFDKGCYTGQEVIARAHYRGRVKRRLQRFVTRGAMPVGGGAIGDGAAAPSTSAALAPGDSGQLADGRPFKIVDTTMLDDGRCEFLAVAPVVSSEAPGTPAAPLPPSAAANDDSATSGLVIDAEQLPLPYALQD